MREKLIELLNNSFDKQYSKRGLLTAPHTADDLIANGVVVSKMETTTKWIPVTDENPKEAGEYIVKIAYASHATALWYNPVEDVWFSDDYRDRYPVTHWMPLPEPPKGE